MMSKFYLDNKPYLSLSAFILSQNKWRDIMNKKTCSKCKKEKNIDCFRKEKRTKSGLQSQCKECEKKYRELNKEKYSNYMKKYYKENKEEINKKNKIYRINHKDEIKKRDKKYRETHREQINNREIIRRKNDKIYNLKCNVRGMIKNSFRRCGFKKKQKAEKIYGCSVDELINHLIKTYENNYNEKWSWEYLNEVHVDHIIPLATATNEKDVIRLCHYSNLQLLKAKDNLCKSSKLDWSINNE